MQIFLQILVIMFHNFFELFRDIVVVSYTVLWDMQKNWDSVNVYTWPIFPRLQSAVS